MPIKCKTDMSKLFAKIDTRIDAARENFQEAFQKTCLEITNLAKSTNTYKDQTNNLRSSIGYIVYDKGELVNEMFTKAGIGAEGDGSKGINQGKQIAEQAVKKYPDALVGVIVAGMEYALYVEAKGYDVLTGSCIQAKTILEKNLKLTE
jgi:hypothetical protein